MYADGMPFDGNTIKEGQSLGGSESMAYYVARELVIRDHSVFMFSNVPTNSQQGQKKIDGVTYMPIGEKTKQFPFGINFENYAQKVPCDVMLLQRTPGIFAKPYNSKLNYFWAHDLALKRYQAHINSMLWNTDRFLGVSHFHKKQILEVYGLPKQMVDVLPNGIDLDLWKPIPDAGSKIRSKTMLYAARPERGLINLVKEGGIMERLLKYDPEIKLLVCSYNNHHPSMNQQYNYLYQRCDQLLNVQNIGFLSKQQLAQVELNCWLYVYPTEFEDTSCIMIMENAAAGTPVVACNKGALGETSINSGVYWSDLENFEKAIIYLHEKPERWKSLHKKALKGASSYSIETTVNKLEEMVHEDFKKLTSDKQKMYDHFVYNSELFGAKIYAEQNIGVREHSITRYKTYEKPMEETVDFYDISAKRCFDLGNTHGMENPRQLLHMGRMQPVIQELSLLPPDARVLDYGCCVGQLTFALKHRFPDMAFLGVDISKDQIDYALKHKEKNKVNGVDFEVCTTPKELIDGGKEFDAVLCLEVLEHVWDHVDFLNDIILLTKENGKIIVSTPFGPYEENSDDPDPLYQHLHNFEEQDIIDLVGFNKDFSVSYVSDADSKKGEQLGNYVWSWTKTDIDPFLNIGPIDWDRKFKQQRPRERVSVCMIVKKDNSTLKRCLNSVKGMADEFIIAVDDPDWLNDDLSNTQDQLGLIDLLIKTYPNMTIFPIESPLKQGFAEARNESVKDASGDWILWIDDDEEFVWPERFNRFLRHNVFDSYSIAHHHMAADPLGLLKTDYPTRLYRNNRDIQFFGIVHEHPETEINKGPGKVFMVPRELGCIMHYGYETEEVRRKRFARNYPLMVRDRQLNPERKLGKFLWIRDLSHRNRFEIEMNGGHITDECRKRAKEALELWRSELDTSTLRMVYDSLGYVTESVALLTNNQGISFKFALNVGSRGIGDPTDRPIQKVFQGMLETKEDIAKLIDIVLREKINYAETGSMYV